MYLFGKPDCIDFIDYRPYLSLRSRIVWYQPSRLAQKRINYTNNYDVICYFVKGDRPKTLNLDAIRVPQLVELEHRLRCERVPSVTKGKYGKTKFHDNGKNPGDVWGDIKQLTYKSKELVRRKALNTIQKPEPLIVDRYSRTIYDRVPEPPPRGPQGADRLTILEDTDRDGRADRCKDFVSDLNLCVGLEFGYGGVFVMQAPYLLFYPDRNRDDVPDGDPEVLLSGFGMEDAQAMANHWTWGPDGWLYGLNGSTTTCRIRGLEFQQGVWRYHPVTREFEGALTDFPDAGRYVEEAHPATASGPVRIPGEQRTGE